MKIQLLAALLVDSGLSDFRIPLPGSEQDPWMERQGTTMVVANVRDSPTPFIIFTGLWYTIQTPVCTIHPRIWRFSGGNEVNDRQKMVICY